MMKARMFLFATIASAMTIGTANSENAKPTIVLVHGAFADSSSWNGVVAQLQQHGYAVVAVANPLRGVDSDADYTRRVVGQIEGSVVLVGHSYGGAVITEAAWSDPKVTALVYVAAFAPETDESAGSLSIKFVGSTLAPTLADPVLLMNGQKDLYIRQDQFPEQFAADVPKSDAEAMAAIQRPVTEAALAEAPAHAAWKRIPSWFIYGSADKNIPPTVMRWMADRARSKRTVVVDGASHVVMVSHASEVATLIEEAAGRH